MNIKIGLAAVVIAIALMGLALRPVCVPLSAVDVSQFNPPIETRTDRDLYVRVFQQRDGQWHQCKTWLSRLFFF